MGKKRINPDPDAGTDRHNASTDNEVERRVNDAEELILQGWRDRRVALHLADKYHVTERGARNWVMRAWERRKADLAAEMRDAPTREQRFAESRARMLLAYEVALADRRPTAMLRAAEVIAKMDGFLHTHVKVSGIVGHRVELGPEQEAQADEVLKRHGYVPPELPADSPELN